jgi:hypothetical protein
MGIVRGFGDGPGWAIYLSGQETRLKETRLGSLSPRPKRRLGWLQVSREKTEKK